MKILKKSIGMIFAVLFISGLLFITTDINVYGATITEGNIYVSTKEVSDVSDEDYFQTLEEASEYFRKEMVNRSSTISISISMNYYNNIVEDLFSLATGYSDDFTSSEGDYLKAHLLGYSGNIYSSSKGCTIVLNMNYLSTKDEEYKVNSEVKRVLDELNVYDKDDYTKVKAVHDYIVKNINYDYTFSNHSAYNAIVDKSTVCQGFASLTYKMLRELGLGVRYISGTGNGGAHAWNIVKLNNKWYNLDNTWDENISNDDYISYEYFLKPSNDFEDHNRDEEYNTSEFNEQYPMATSPYLGIISFTSDKSSPQVAGTSVNLSVNAVGEGVLQYKFLIRDNDKGTWYKLRDFSTSNKITWNANSVGNKTLYVDVKDKNGNVVRKELNFVVKNKDTQLKINSFTTDKASPQVSGTKVTLKADAIGNGALQYKFLIRDNDKGTWYKLRDFAPLNTFIWTPGAKGNKTLYVDVKDSTGKVVRKELSFIVK